jgi:hypothetical protein
MLDKKPISQKQKLKKYKEEFDKFYLELCDILKGLFEDDLSQMLAGRDFKKPYPYATNYLMEIIMVILNEKLDT